MNMIFNEFLIFFLFFPEKVQESRGVNTVNRNFFQLGPIRNIYMRRNYFSCWVAEWLAGSVGTKLF